jgi:hypothetical protein
MVKNKITDEMADNIKACMLTKVDKGTIKQVVRGYYNASTSEIKERNNIILGHYQKLSEIERRHKEDMEDEIKEYIEKAKQCNGKKQN